MGKVFKATGVQAPAAATAPAPGKHDKLGQRLVDMKKTAEEKTAARGGKNTAAQALYPHLD